MIARIKSYLHKYAWFGVVFGLGWTAGNLFQAVTLIGMGALR